MRRLALLILVGAVVVSACATSSLEGNGDVVAENRTVSAFDTVRADNGVEVVLTIDPLATGDAALAVTTDSNLQEFLATEVSDNTLQTSPDRDGGVTSTGGFEVSGTIGAIVEASADNGAQTEITGATGDLTLSANNGAKVDGSTLEATTAAIEADNAGEVTVCATGTVSGAVDNGAELIVLCAGSTDGVETSNGGKVSTTR
jgi:hypothetical protein